MYVYVICTTKPNIKTIKTVDFLNFKFNENVENDGNKKKYILMLKLG
jgi:hypothetical protein